jgi:hypothetical protein
MHLAAGLTEPSTGSVEFFGRPVPVGGPILGDVGFVVQVHPAVPQASRSPRCCGWTGR